MANIVNKPMYQKIKDDILHQIKIHALSPGDQIPTEHQLMKQYGVSRITVSKALNELKGDGIIERFPNKGSFVAPFSGAPAVLPSNKITPTPEDTNAQEAMPEVACIIPSIPDLFSLTMLNGILSVFQENNYLCHIFASNTPETENYLLKRCLETKTAGLVLFPHDQLFFSDELLRMQLQKYPLVLLDRYLPRLDTSYVISDNRVGSELCVKHLHNLGHQRIAFLTCSDRDTLSIDHRVEGVYSAAEQLNIPESCIYIVDHCEFWDRSKNYDELLLSLIKEKKVTGIISSESRLCAYLFERLSALKIEVPGNVSLISFDRTLSKMKSQDFFTHINQSEYLMGREAAMILRRRIENHDMNIYHKVITPTLEIHQSTGRVII